MRYKLTAGLPALLVLFGCVHTQPDSAPAPTQSGAQQGPNNVQDTQKASPDKTEPHPAQPHAPATTQSNPSATQGKDATKAPPRATGTSSAGATAEPSSGASSKPSSPRNSSTAPGTSSAATGKTNNATTTTQPPVKTPTSAPPAAASLDLAALETRLKDTRAIGVFTKLSLKNQVDDLLSQFRAFYSKKAAIPLSALRQRYDLLLIKVLSLLQDGDPDLAAAISSSREAIWGVLADPEKFAKL